MTENHQDNNKGLLYAEALVPVLAFGGTLGGVALYNAGILSEIQYAAAGSFLASCLLAYLAWTRVRKDIVALSTPLYGLIFFITPIDFAGGVMLQLFYAAGLTILAARLRYRFGPGISGGSDTKELDSGPLRDYVESVRDAIAGLSPSEGHNAALVFFYFAGGEYARAADLSHAASCRDGTHKPLYRAFSILRQHAELLEKNQQMPVTYIRFPPDDAALLAKPLPGSGNPERDFEAMMDNALLFLFSAAWHASPEDRQSLLVSQRFAGRLLET